MLSLEEMIYWVRYLLIHGDVPSLATESIHPLFREAFKSFNAVRQIKFALLIGISCLDA